MFAIDHADGHASSYSGLAHVLALSTDRFRRRRKERVRAGAVIGYLQAGTGRLLLEISRDHRPVDASLELLDAVAVPVDHQGKPKRAISRLAA